MIEHAREVFRSRFHAEPAACGVAPGRVEVLGNHTDYNDGFILSAAIDRYTVVCGRAVPEEMGILYSETFDTTETFPLGTLEKTETPFWPNYLKGVIAEVRKAVPTAAIGGFEAAIVTDVPIGAGLSGSAALEVAFGYFLQQLFAFPMDELRMAFACKAAENNFVGVKCGILDQFSSCHGRKDHLVFLDVRYIEQSEHIPLGEDIEIVLANTHAQHDLADGVYNSLQEDCFVAAEHFRRKMGEQVTHLRDITMEDFQRHAEGLPTHVIKRARHVVKENQRVLKAVEGLREKDLHMMRQLMLASHASSRDDFGNSCPELDLMVGCALGLPGFHGARLSGGGFGGITVNLVEADKAHVFAAEIARRYEAATGIHPDVHVCRVVDGARGAALD
jgi:galactokinase